MMDRSFPKRLIVNRISWLLLLIASLWVLKIRLNVGAHPPHMDEYDYLFVGRQLVSGLSWPTHSYIFGSDISWYIFGFFDQHIGGYTGARVASVLFGVVSLLGAYLFALQLWSSKPLAAFSTLLLAASAQHIFISTLATYDIVSFCFFTWALVTAVSTVKKPSYSVSILSAVLLSLAVICKYTTILYLPLIGLALIFHAPRQALIGASVVFMALTIYAANHFSQLSTLYEVQIVGVHGANSSRSDIAIRIFQQIGLPLYLGLCAILMSLLQISRGQCSANRLLLMLLVFSLPMPVYHLYSGNHIALYKHLNYSFLFLFPLAASFLYYASMRLNAISASRRILVPFLLTVYFFFNTMQLQSIKFSYPDTTDLARLIVEKDMGIESAVLSEDPYMFRYLAPTGFPQSHIKETTWLDNDLDGIHSPQDVKDALWDRKFKLVLLTDQIHANRNLQYRRILSQRGYIALYNQPYKLSNFMSTNTLGRLTLYERQISEVEQVSLGH